MLKILILGLKECVPFIGGVERVTRNLANYWIDNGYSIICVAALKSSGSKDGDTDQIKHYFLPEPKRELYNSNENIDFLCSIIDAEKVDIVINQVSNIPTFASLCENVKQKTKVKLITTFHFDYNDLSKARRQNFFIKEKLQFNANAWIRDIIGFISYNLYERFKLIKRENKNIRRLLSFSDAVVFLSKKALDFYQLKFPLYSSKMYAIPNPMVMHDDHTSIPITERKKQVLYVGRLELGQKRVDRVLRIWKEIEAQDKGWSLKVIGDGPQMSFLKNMTKNLGLKNVNFTGTENPLKYYQESQMVCLTSNSEGFGMVLIEAQSCGCIPVSFGCSFSIFDIIDNGKTGIIVKSYNNSEYAKQILRLLKDDILRQTISENCLNASKRYDIRNVGQLWTNLFAQLKAHH